MENPFPGMDPWMEDQWGDAHHSIITYARDALREVLPADLRPRVEERVFLETPIGPAGERIPDVRVVEHVRAIREPLPPAAGGVATAEPLVLEFLSEPITEGFIQIIDRHSGNRVVTVIEVLSPSNKAGGEGRRAYREKQDECLAGGVNLIEIDLLRGGRRASVIDEALVPTSHRTPYRVTVWRAARRKKVEFYRIPLRDRLPSIRIPLRDTDEDVPLDLQPLIDKAYVNGTYEDTDYSVDPVPPLSPEDATWADGILRAKGLRK